MLQDPRPYLEDFQLVAETARGAAQQVTTTAPAVAHGAVRASRLGAKAARRTKWLWKPTLWMMSPLRHVAERRLLGEQGGGSDTASTTTAGGGGGGLAGSPIVLATEGLVGAVQPLLTTPRASETGSVAGSSNNNDGGGGASPGSEHRLRKGYRSDPDEPHSVLQQPQASALAPAGAEVFEMGGAAAAAAAGAAGALYSGAKRTVKAGVQAGVQAGQQLGQQLRLGSHGQEGYRGGEDRPTDLEQGPGGEATRGSVYEGLRRDVQSALGGGAPR